MTFNLMQLFQQKYCTFGSFGAGDGVAKTAGGMLPVIDTEAEFADF
jgi:hypothetical protein